MPAGGSPVKVSWGFPVLEVGVISENGKRVLSPTQVVSPMGECFHHGEQLSFVDVIVTFGGGEGGGVVGNRVELGFSLFVQWHISLTSFLGEHHSDSICRGISL